MSTWMAVTRRYAALGDPEHPLCLAATELREARVAYARAKMLDPSAKPRQRRGWPERARLVAAEREYTSILRAVERGDRVSGGGA